MEGEDKPPTVRRVSHKPMLMFVFGWHVHPGWRSVRRDMGQRPRRLPGDPCRNVGNQRRRGRVRGAVANDDAPSTTSDPDLPRELDRARSRTGAKRNTCRGKAAAVVLGCAAETRGVGDGFVNRRNPQGLATSAAGFASASSSGARRSTAASPSSTRPSTTRWPSRAPPWRLTPDSARAAPRRQRPHPRVRGRASRRTEPHQGGVRRQEDGPQRQQGGAAYLVQRGRHTTPERSVTPVPDPRAIAL